MKKMFFVFALATVLVLSFSSVAFAKYAGWAYNNPLPDNVTNNAPGYLSWQGANAISANNNGGTSVNGNTPHGLAGDMGVSSERVGPLRGSTQDNTHGAGPAHPEAPYDADEQGRATSEQVAARTPPEQNAETERAPEVQPDLPPRTAPSQGAPNPLGPGPEFTPDDDWRTVQTGEPGARTGDAEGRTEFDAVERAEKQDPD